jgi:hypothetical protein
LQGREETKYKIENKTKMLRMEEQPLQDQVIATTAAIKKETFWNGDSAKTRYMKTQKNETSPAPY